MGVASGEVFAEEMSVEAHAMSKNEIVINTNNCFIIELYVQLSQRLHGIPLIIARSCDTDNSFSRFCSGKGLVKMRSFYFCHQLLAHIP